MPTLLQTELTHDELLHELRRLEMKARRLVTASFAGEYRSAFRGTGLEIDQIRPYAYGDDVRTVDWNVTARTGSLHVKLYREEREQTVFVLLDVSASQAFGTGTRQKIRCGLEVAALLGFSALTNNDRFGLALCTDQLEAYFPPRKGRNHLLNALGRTLETQPAHRGTGLRQGLEFVLRTQKRHANIVVISDFLDSGYEQALASLAAPHDVLLLRLQHPEEALPAGLGVLPVADAETGRERMVFTGFNLRALFGKPRPAGSSPFARRFAEVHQRLSQLSRRYGMGYVALRTDEDYVHALRRYFHQRALARRK